MSSYGKAKKDKKKQRFNPTASKVAEEGEGQKGTGGFVFNHALGQHILKNPMIVTNIVEKAALKSTDVVMEIGPGTGNMTVQMLPLCKKVIVIEFDPRMVAELQRRVQGTEHAHKLTIVHGDAMKVKFPYFDVCIANLPYQISSPITFKLLSHRPMWRCALLMYQHEFAMRLLAKPGNAMFCRLSLNTQLLAEVSHVMKVSKNNFRPPPKVESSVVRIKPKHPPPPINFLEWDGMARLCFSRKNKTLGAIFKTKSVLKLLEENYKTFCALKGKKPVEGPFKQYVIATLEDTGLSKSRSSKLGEDDFLKLLCTFNDAGMHFST